MIVDRIYLKALCSTAQCCVPHLLSIFKFSLYFLTFWLCPPHFQPEQQDESKHSVLSNDELLSLPASVVERILHPRTSPLLLLHSHKPPPSRPCLPNREYRRPHLFDVLLLPDGETWRGPPPARHAHNIPQWFLHHPNNRKEPMGDPEGRATIHFRHTSEGRYHRRPLPWGYNKRRKTGDCGLPQKALEVLGGGGLECVW